MYLGPPLIGSAAQVHPFAPFYVLREKILHCIVTNNKKKTCLTHLFSILCPHTMNLFQHHFLSETFIHHYAHWLMAFAISRAASFLVILFRYNLFFVSQRHRFSRNNSIKCTVSSLLIVIVLSDTVVVE